MAVDAVAHNIGGNVSTEPSEQLLERLFAVGLSENLQLPFRHAKINDGVC